MASEVYYGRCKCCLKETYLKNMWFTGQMNEDEIFGQMLVDCFSIDWMIHGDLEEDKICEDCITKLKIAVEFKRQVLRSQTESLNLDKDNNTQTWEVGIAPTPLSSEGRVTEANSNEEEEEVEQEEVEEEESSENDEKDDDFEYIEEEALVEKDPNDDNGDCDSQGIDDDSQDYEPVEKQPKLNKKQKHKRTRIQLKYTEEALQKAVEAFKSKEMTRAKAAETFKVPLKAISRRAYGLDTVKETVNKGKEDIYNSKEVEKAMKAILIHTNATPFRLKNTKFYCFFCPADAPGFEDPNELREHTFSAHDDIVADIGKAIRPPYNNQIIRVDIFDLNCDCGEDITWPNLLEHFEKRHNITDINDAWKKIVPFLLVNGPRKNTPCALCDVSASITAMDIHINKHYPNFLCKQCGKPFVTLYRLNAHEHFHDDGHYACEVCGKVFSNLRRKGAHFSVQHCNKLYHKCTYCPEQFASARLRDKHLKNDHKDLLETKGNKCNVCNKSFWLKDYWLHMKTSHPKYKCNKCDQKFGTKYLLGSHSCVVETVQYQCDLCYEMFDTVDEVVGHKETCKGGKEESLKKKFKKNV